MDQPNSLAANPQGQLDAMARQQGFRDYATMMAWQRNRSASLQDSHTTVAPAHPAAPAERQPDEGIFGYIIRKMSGK